jgi:hypothetical protein
MKHLVTITPDGTIIALETKKGLDVKALGHADIKRSSLIVWQEEEQAWEIHLLHGQFRGIVTAGTFLMYANGCGVAPAKYYQKPTRWWHKLNPWKRYPMIPLWNNYDEAVAAEIVIIQTMRLLNVEV